jgi:hypothetical protein
MMPISDEHLKALGRITEQFASLEFVLDRYIRVLIGLEDLEIGEMVAAQLAFKRKVDLVGSIFGYRFSNDARVDELDAWLVKALNVEEKRNTIVHSTWAGTEHGPHVALRMKKSVSRKNGLRELWQGMSPELIDEIAEEIQGVVNGLMVFSKKCWPDLER